MNYGYLKKKNQDGTQTVFKPIFSQFETFCKSMIYFSNVFKKTNLF